MFYEVAQGMVNEYHAVGDFDGFQLEMFRRFSAESPVDEEGFRKVKAEELTEQVYEAAIATYARHNQTLAAQAMPVISDVYLNQGAAVREHRCADHRWFEAPCKWSPIYRSCYKQPEDCELIGKHREVHHPRHHRQRVEGALARDGRVASERTECQHRAEGPPVDLQVGELQPLQSHDGEVER
jgi:hypothetical protein